jgi:hypothetical protein
MIHVDPDAKNYVDRNDIVYDTENTALFTLYKTTNLPFGSLKLRIVKMYTVKANNS